MPFVAFVALIVVLAIGLVPPGLSRHALRDRPHDHLIAAHRTRPAVVRNASIAYALRMAAFIPLFAWGASGDLWPAVVASASFGLGTWLVYLLRRPLVAFVDDALARERSITVHAFIGSAYGHDAGVRVVAATITLCALFALVVGEMLAAAAVLGPMLESSRTLVLLLVLAAIVAIATTLALDGHSGVMHSAQLQLGMLYLGLFGATALVLYLHISARTPLRPHVALAIAFIAGFGPIVLWYRRSRYVDTEAIRSDERVSPSRPARALARFGKILNGVLSALLVLVVVVAFLDLQAVDGLNLARHSAAALAATTQTPGVALLAIALLALFYPLIDVTNWLRLAALRKNADVAPHAERPTLRAVFAIYAIESALIVLFVCALGAIAGGVLAPSGGETSQAFAAWLVAADNAVAVAAAVLLSICVLAAAVTTIGALLAAGLATLYYDFLLQVGSNAVPPEMSTAMGATTIRRRTLIAALTALGVAVVLSGALAGTSLRDDVPGGALPALLTALCAAQLSFVPLVLGSLAGPAPPGDRAMKPGWAVAILAIGPVSALGAVAAWFATGSYTWLWSAVPASMGLGFLLYALGRATSPRAR